MAFQRSFAIREKESHISVAFFRERERERVRVNRARVNYTQIPLRTDVPLTVTAARYFFSKWTARATTRTLSEGPRTSCVHGVIVCRVLLMPILLYRRAKFVLFEYNKKWTDVNTTHTLEV